MTGMKRLKQSLGLWIRQTHRRGKGYYAPDKHLLMIRDASEEEVKWHIHDGIGNTPEEGFEIEETETITTRDITTWFFVPADMTRHEEGICIEYRAYKLPERPKPATSLMEHVQSKHTALIRLLHGLNFVHDDAVYWIRRQWETNGLLISATDGSAPDDGTFGWVLALPDGTTLVECSGPADGAQTRYHQAARNPRAYSPSDSSYDWQQITWN